MYHACAGRPAVACVRAPGYVAGLVAARRDTTIDEVHKIGCPTLVVWGGEDRVVPAACGAVLAKRIPDVELVVWSGVGHAPMIERAEDFAALAREFTARTFLEPVS